ncbi:acyltransferase family protein [Pseudomonas syringae]|nr:acyltransferase family protein [Pseudomonas syringae]MCF5075143.1 acyltransferase family protein [Pseudomonas syringae]MCF5117421.1 acyltransferase family protein [Pseudomonas syringae]MCF5379583.1 acyltransferase family protein [Pseudomonas syringae]
MSSHPQYRPDIDGMRALAVMAVVIYHAFPTLIPGGFIGVDVFFVISGYLITGILLKNLASGRLDIFDFYARRAKRIFPALSLVLLFCVVFGWFFLFDSEYRKLGKHVASGAGFVANLTLWSESGYFDAAAELKPLLHLWSLGVEEQFYLAWPLVLWLGWKFRKTSLIVIPALAIASFYLCVTKVSSDPVEAFYSPLTRFWELAFGGILSYLHIHRRVSRAARPQWISEISAIGALMLLAGGFAIIDASKPFPGMLAAVPVAASLLLIGPAEGSMVTRLVLANRFAVWIGLISFPLYLWHWPLISLATILKGEFPSAEYRRYAVLAAILLAWLTYKFVEKPIRFSQRSIVPKGLAALVLVIGCSGYLVYKGAAVEIKGPNEIAAEYGQKKFFDYLAGNYQVCSEASIRETALTYDGRIRCMQSKPGPNVDLAIIGDSHAEHLFNGIANSLPDLNVAYYIKASAPFVGNTDFKEIYEFLERPGSPKKVMIAVHWIKRMDQISKNSSLEKEVLASVQKLLANGKDVYLVDDTPRFPVEPKKCLIKARVQKHACSVPISEAKREFDAYEGTLLNVLRREPRIKYVPINQYFCDSKRCSMTLNGRLLFRDKNHLNVSGSNYVGELLLRDNPGLFN